MTIGTKRLVPLSTDFATVPNILDTAASAVFRASETVFTEVIAEQAVLCKALKTQSSPALHEVFKAHSRWRAFPRFDQYLAQT